MNNQDIKKAIEIISRKSSIPNDGESFNNIENAYDMAIDALEKQTPLKHHHTKIAGFKEKEPKMRFSICPSCLSVIVTAQNEYPKFCPWCGQAIDWEGDKDE